MAQAARRVFHADKVWITMDFGQGSVTMLVPARLNQLMSKDNLGINMLSIDEQLELHKLSMDAELKYWRHINQA